MRKLLPWSLLILLGLGTGLGAVVAVSSAPQLSPATWVANVLSTTAASGSAHFTYTHVTNSPNRNERERLAGQGEVNFTNGNILVTEVDHGIEFVGGPVGPSHPEPSTSKVEEIGIGTTMYSEYFDDGPLATWTKLTHWRNPHSGLGILSIGNAGVALQGLVAGLTPVDRVRDLGPANLDGHPTTRYLVSNTAPRVCPSAHKSAITDTQSPSTLWIDPEGRLVQVEISFHESGQLPASALAKNPELAQIPMGPSTTTATLRLSDFGTPVRVSAPPARLLNRNLGQSKGFAIIMKKCGK
jgi:hypothetical protein